jgi:hypothetical protein
VRHAGSALAIAWPEGWSGVCIIRATGLQQAGGKAITSLSSGTQWSQTPKESLPAAWAPRTKGAASAVVASAAVLSTVRRVSTASPILASLQSCRGASRLVGSSFGGLRSPVWSDPRYGRYTFPRGQYRTTRPRRPILHPPGVHSRHGADHVVKRSNRSIDLRIRPREYVGLRIRKLEAGDPDHHLVRMPSVAWPRTMPAQPSSDRGANFSTQRRTVS